MALSLVDPVQFSGGILMMVRQREGFWDRFWQWTARQIVEDVPEEIAVCEFDCAQPRCSHDRWRVCERRKQTAEGELMPTSTPLVHAE